MTRNHPLELPLPSAPSFVDHGITEEELEFHLVQLGWAPKPGTDGGGSDDFINPPQSFTAWACQNRFRPLLVAAVVDYIATGAHVGAWVGLEANV